MLKCTKHTKNWNTIKLTENPFTCFVLQLFMFLICVKLLVIQHVLHVEKWFCPFKFLGAICFVLHVWTQWYLWVLSLTCALVITVEFTRLGPLPNVQLQLLCIQLCPYIISHRNWPVKDTVDWRTVDSYASANISVKCIDWQWRLQTMQLCCVCVSLVYKFVAYFKSTDNHLYINLSMQLYHYIS